MFSADSYDGSQSSPGDDFPNGSQEGQEEEPQDGRLQLETLGGLGHARIDEVQVTEGRRLGGSSSGGGIQTPQDTRKDLSTSVKEGYDTGRSGAIEAVDKEGSAARRRDDQGLLTGAPSGPVHSLNSLGTSSSTSAGLGQGIDRSSPGIDVGNRPEESSSLGNREESSFHSMMGSLPPGFVQCPGCPNVRLDTVCHCSTFFKYRVSIASGSVMLGSFGHARYAAVSCRVMWQVYELVSNEEAARGGSGGVAIQELPKGANLSRRAAMRYCT